MKIEKMKFTNEGREYIFGDEITEEEKEEVKEWGHMHNSVAEIEQRLES